MKELEKTKEKINRETEVLFSISKRPRDILPALIVSYSRQYGYTTDEAIKVIRKDLQNLKD